MPLIRLIFQIIHPFHHTEYTVGVRHWHTIQHVQSGTFVMGHLTLFCSAVDEHKEKSKDSYEIN